MAPSSSNNFHPIGCSCRACSPVAERHRRARLAIKGASRALFLIAALIAIPFIIVHALSSAKDVANK